MLGLYLFDHVSVSFNNCYCAVVESKLDPFWVTFLDAKKQLFVSEKYMSTASEEGTQ